MRAWLKIRHDLALMHLAEFFAYRLDDEMFAYWAALFRLAEDERRAR